MWVILKYHTQWEAPSGLKSFKLGLGKKFFFFSDSCVWFFLGSIIDLCLSLPPKKARELCLQFYMIYLLFSHSVKSDPATSWTAAHQASLSFTISQSFLKLMSIESAMSSNHLTLCRPLLCIMCSNDIPAAAQRFAVFP